MGRVLRLLYMHIRKCGCVQQLKGTRTCSDWSQENVRCKGETCFTCACQSILNKINSKNKEKVYQREKCNANKKTTTKYMSDAMFASCCSFCIVCKQHNCVYCTQQWNVNKFVCVCCGLCFVIGRALFVESGDMRAKVSTYKHK